MTLLATVGIHMFTKQQVIQNAWHTQSINEEEKYEKCARRSISSDVSRDWRNMRNMRTWSAFWYRQDRCTLNILYLYFICICIKIVQIWEHGVHFEYEDRNKMCEYFDILYLYLYFDFRCICILMLCSFPSSVMIVGRNRNLWGNSWTRYCW